MTELVSLKDTNLDINNMGLKKIEEISLASPKNESPINITKSKLSKYFRP